MKDFLIGFIGFIVGGLHGIVLMCMMQVAKKSDEATTTFTEGEDDNDWK